MSDSRVILLAVDGSEYSDHALDWYLQKMKKEGDHIIFVHVTETPSLPVFTLKSGIAPTEEWEEILRKQLAEVSKLEDSCVARAQAAKLKYDFLHVQNQSAGPGIVEKAKEKNIELVIIGTRGQNKVRRTMLGSVSDYVLHHAGIPVAVVPPLKPAAE